MNHYETLGIERGASAEEIKAAWRRASSAAHPDKEGGSTAAMQAINAAYEVLGDPARRARYDESGDDSGERSIRQEAMGMLVRFFRDALTTDEPVLSFVEIALRALELETKVAMAEWQTRQKRLHKRRKAVKSKGADNLFHALVDEQLADIAQRLVLSQKLLEVAAACHGLLLDYEDVQDANPAPSFAGLFYNNAPLFGAQSSHP
ncbi:J domain-containing protein [Variovorax sp. dw_954]|uniref:J domain-containing protein n=1 Tax=Variovorax sp. dw_954 TaxID=2720078 RepID=UPI001BD5E245|nr:J domain-containing protein [Variovorax sp. dw_954]